MKINLIANIDKVLIGFCYTAETEITIGREVGNTIAPLAVEGLSRRHAKIYVKDGKWILEEGDFNLKVGNQTIGIECSETKKWEEPNI